MLEIALTVIVVALAVWGVIAISPRRGGPGAGTGQPGGGGAEGFGGDGGGSG